MLAARSEDLDLASRVNVSIATGRGGREPYPRGDRGPLVITYQTVAVASTRHSHINYRAAILESITHCDVLSPAPPASRWRRSTEIRTTYF
jgi:hypothetical protein